MSVSVEKINVSKLGDKLFERYEKEVRLWGKVSDVSAEKQAFMMALSLPETDKNGVPIRDLVMDEIDSDSAKYSVTKIGDSGICEGLENLLVFMKQKLGKDDLEDCIHRFDAFDNQSIDDYIHGFDERKRGLELPSAEVLAFKLLRCSNMEENDVKLVKTGMDYSDKSTLYEQRNPF